MTELSLATNSTQLGLSLKALRQAPAFPFEATLVTDCLDLKKPSDLIFEKAWRESLSALPPALRWGALPGVTGHVAESVVELIFAGHGYHVVWHFAGPGGHGVDLIFLSPSDERLLAVEVKGTVRPKHWPRLSRRELTQMSAAWMDKADNPGMANWNLTAGDIYGGVVLVNFAEMSYRAAFTSNFLRLQPVEDIDQIRELSWLDSID